MGYLEDINLVVLIYLLIFQLSSVTELKWFQWAPPQLIEDGMVNTVLEKVAEFKQKSQLKSQRKYKVVVIGSRCS